MKVLTTDISDVKIIIPDIFSDRRGYFYESYNKYNFSKIIGLNAEFVQDNHSNSFKGVLRGLHFQKEPFQQGKLVRVIQGEIFDVAVDIRRKSKTFGKWVAVKLSSRNKKQLWIPPGFAHGFLTLSNTAQLLYKTTNFYNPASEITLLYNDIRIGINWPKIDKDFLLNKKDLLGITLDEI